MRSGCSEGGGGETRRFRVSAEYPTRPASLALARRNLAFPLLNLRFGFATAALYTRLSWLLPQPDLRAIDQGIGPAIQRGLVQVAEQPSAISLVVLLLVAVVYFHRLQPPRVPGSGRGAWAHGASHLAAALGATAAGLWCARALGVQHDVVARRGVMIAASGLLGLARRSHHGAVPLREREGVSPARKRGLLVAARGGLEDFRLRVDASGISLWAFGLDRMPERWTVGAWPLPDLRLGRAPVIDAVKIAAPAAE